MKTLEIVGFNREDLGKKYAKRLRAEGSVPCVLYGKNVHKHFHAPMYLFRDLVYTPDVHKVLLNIEGETFEAILQDVVFHPVSETIMHVDFLHLEPGKPVKMEVPVKLVGRAAGVAKGGVLVPKLRKVKIKSTPENLPEYIEIDVSHLDLARSAKVGEFTAEGFEVLTNPRISVASVEIPRALRQQMQGGEGEEGEGEEGGEE